MSRALSLAGFQVTFIGRFWVITEGAIRFDAIRRILASVGQGLARIISCLT